MYDINDFEKIPTASGLFKMAAHKMIKKTQNKYEQKKLSLKYQVLSPETAFVGVVKRYGRSTYKRAVIKHDKFEPLKVEYKKEKKVVHYSGSNVIVDETTPEKQVVRPPKPLKHPTFKELVGDQMASGAWKKDETLAKFFVNGIPRKKRGLRRSQWLTLLAL